MTMNKNIFVHAHTAKKIEMACLLPNWTYEVVVQNISKLIIKSPQEIPWEKRRQLLPALALLKKKSCETYTECLKCLVLYNNAYYLVRTYKFVGSMHYKLEVTKFVNSQQTSLIKAKSIKGSSKLFSSLIRGIEDTLLPYYLHQGEFFSVEEFLNLK